MLNGLSLFQNVKLSKKPLIRKLGKMVYGMEIIYTELDNVVPVKI